MEKINTIKELENEKYLNDKIKEKKSFILYFYNPNFEICQIMLKFIEEMNEKYKEVETIKIDEEKYPNLIEKYKIKLYPTTIPIKEGEIEYEDEEKTDIRIGLCDECVIEEFYEEISELEMKRKEEEKKLIKQRKENMKRLFTFSLIMIIQIIVILSFIAILIGLNSLSYDCQVDYNFDNQTKTEL